MHGNWTISSEKNAAFAQRFIVSGADTGTGTYVAPHAPVTVTGDTWSVRVQCKPSGASTWSDSEYQITFPVKSGDQYSFRLEANDIWPGDQDFNDLVLTFTAPVTETDFLVYGHVSSYSGCLYNPCFFSHILVESLQAYKKATQFPIMKETLKKLYPEYEYADPMHATDPQPDIPGGVMTSRPFKPMMIPLSGSTMIPVKKAQVVRVSTTEKAGTTKAAAKKATAKTELISRTVLRAVEISKPLASVVDIDKTALGKLKDIGSLFCTTEPLVNAAMKFQEYDRTVSELGGGAYTGEGAREDLGQVSTDRNGNYIFQFKRSVLQFIEESNIDVPLGEDETLEAMPDLIVQVLGASMPGGIPYETSPYWNIPNLKRINICIPSSYWHTPTGCHGRPISHIGFIPVGKPSTVTLDTDGRVTCTDNSKSDIPQTNCAAWYSRLRLSACIGKYDQVPRYTIEHRSKRSDGTWTSWDIYQEPLALDNWKTTTNEYVATEVGPALHNLEIYKGATKKNVQSYRNIQGDMDWAGTDWFIKAIIPSWKYTFQGDPGSVQFRIKAYDADGNQVKIWDEPGTSYTLYQDVITLFVDHTGPELNFKDVTIGTPTTNPCPLFTLTGSQLTNATLDLKFKAVQRQGFLNNYELSLTKCNTPDFAVSDQGGHPLKPDYAGGSPCPGLYGTVFGIDTDADTEDYVPVHLTTGGSPWLAEGETVSSFTLNLEARVRRTDGHSVHYPVHYGPRQYNFVVQRGEE